MNGTASCPGSPSPPPAVDRSQFSWPGRDVPDHDAGDARRLEGGEDLPHCSVRPYELNSEWFDLGTCSVIPPATSPDSSTITWGSPMPWSWWASASSMLAVDGEELLRPDRDPQRGEVTIGADQQGQGLGIIAGHQPGHGEPTTAICRIVADRRR